MLRVDSGEEITITVSGRPSARLVGARPVQWRAWEEMPDLFRGPGHSDWERHDLVDTDVRNPWAAR